MAEDPNVIWKQANLLAIESDHAADAWHAGHVNDIVAGEGGAILVGTNSGGVWLIASNNDALPLSDYWDNPDIRCLAAGSNGPKHFFTGCGVSPNTSLKSVLYETDVSAAVPLYSWREVPGVPAEAGTLYRIGVLQSSKIIVIACQGGVFWSPIPVVEETPGCGCLMVLLGTFKPKPAVGSYSWKKAKNLPDGAYFGLAVGPNETVAVGAFGSNIVTGLYGIFYGQIQGGELVMTRADISGVDQELMCATSLASCAQKPKFMYAVSSDGEGRPLAVLRSTDGGKNWTKCAMTLDAAPAHNPPWDIHNALGVQGNGWNNCIGVSPHDPDIVGFGWLASCISTNQGQSWKLVGVEWDAAGNAHSPIAHTHADQHAVFFDPANDKRVLFASDGGVAISDDLGQSFRSNCNRELLNLEFLSTYPYRQWYGTISASYQTDGLVGGGLQDNGNVYCLLEEQETPWLTIDGGDGGLVMFLRTGDLLRASYGPSNVHLGLWDENTKTFSGTAALNVKNTQQGINAFVEIVNAPSWRNQDNQLMYAVGGQSAEVYGLFGNDDGSGMHWEFLNTLPLNPDQYIIGIGSSDGHRVFLGTQGGLIFTLDMATNTVQKGTGLPPFTAAAAVSRIVVQSGTLAFLIYNINGSVTNVPFGGKIYRTTDGTNWAALGGGLPNELFFGMETDWTVSPKTLYVATDSRVYSSYDNGDNWQSASEGLPRRPHGADLRFVLQQDGLRYLYLSTFGRSVWRAALDAKP